ncbi:hypothetical protein EUX98_g5655 [Antrodiella citrinella]|uniref:Superkiller protein 3 n=1 Tax=Antrodiella citrinella TaxID=2447956 RepID=A0A4S4MT31_9APHY|nr:hypothetical protein EUX98_g5655 [Antrodiella citrinella]
MASFVKAKLKNAREALGKKNYESARDAATEVLSFEPENYHANVFLGMACLELGDKDHSEQAYRNAIESNPDQVLAWQGITKLYERTENWGQYADSLQQMVQLFLKSNDAVKCAETLQRFLDLRRAHGSPSEICDTLSLWLPDSVFYPLLSTLPPLDATVPTSATIPLTQAIMQNSLPTIEEIVTILENEEFATIKNEVEKRRTRLGAAGPEQIRKELPGFYNEIMNHPYASDDLRRTTESKLLRHKQRLLHALPANGDSAVKKAEISSELHDLVNGMVFLEIPDELAWLIFMENKDAPTIESYDLGIFRKYLRLFPKTTMQNLLHAYLRYYGLPASENTDSESEPANQPDDDHDYAQDALDAFQKLPDSVIAHRIAVEIYEQDVDYDNTFKIAESGLELTQQSEKNNSIQLPRSSEVKAFEIALATSLIHLYPPKHHTRALRLLNDILAEDPDNVRCLMGRAYILQHANKWGEAKSVFDHVVTLLPGDMEEGIRAQEESAWCTVQSRDPDIAAALLQSIVGTLDSLDGREVDQARCWWRLGQCHWDMGDREVAYRHFITSLKRSFSFASAYTSLGIYYAEVASPPDPKRASKCFQKAFELDPREGDAARRLAEGFAEERDWDLVEVVARRTIDGEGGLNAGIESASAAARSLPVNAWAWKALGVVEMNRQHYAPAIQAFQIALRTDPEDQLSWLRLGEVYSKAGRYEAAMKALKRAEELNPDDWIASYFLGDVERQTGRYWAAIDIFSAILSKQPQETKVILTLAQTHFALGRAELSSFFAARAESSFLACIQTALQLLETGAGYRRIIWKVAADALYQLSRLSTFSDIESTVTVAHQMLSFLTEKPREQLLTILTSPQELDGSSDPNLAMSLLEAAIIAYHYRATLGALDDAASGSACHDIGISLSSYALRLSDEDKRERATQQAIAYFREALALDPMNDRYWNTLGTALFSSQPRTAQHAYIRALEIDSRNAATWTNLGLFYLYHEDAQLATEAFYKAQILDPDYALAWVGRGLIATSQGNDPESKAFFEHSISLPAPVLDADVAFATRLLSHLNSIRDYTSLNLHPAFFVLGRFCKQRSQDAYGWHLFGLVCESIGKSELGIEAIGRAIEILEAAYEESEDPILERRFAIAHVNIGRLRLSAGDYEEALGALEVALGLLPEDAPDQATRSLLAQAQLCSGLAAFKLGQLEEALRYFESAVETSVDELVIRSHAVVVLAQTLWAIGTEDGKEAAKAHLLQSIESDPDNLLAINALAGMGILTDDDSLVDAALSEILSLSIQEREDRDPEGNVTSLLIQHHLSQGDVGQAMSTAQKAVAAHPSQSKSKRQLAVLAIQAGQTSSAQAVLTSLSAEEEFTVARDSAALQALVGSSDEAQKGSSLRLVQKAVMLAPWKTFDWRILAYVRSRS